LIWANVRYSDCGTLIAALNVGALRDTHNLTEIAAVFAEHKGIVIQLVIDEAKYLMLICKLNCNQ
jgi:hypothetical protein